MSLHRGQVGPSSRAVPVVRLSTEMLVVGADEVRAAVLRLDFDYDGVIVRAGARRDARVLRDRDGEAQARRLLESLGAIELDFLEDCAAPPGAAIDYVLRLDGDVHALCAFSAYAVPQRSARGWRVTIDDDYPWQVVDAKAPLYVDLAADERPDWFTIELGVEVDGQRVNLLPALLELLDATSSLDQLARLPRRCIAVPGGERRFLPVPPERLRLLFKVLMEMYGGAARRGALPLPRAAAVADLGAALHDPGRPGRWCGEPRIRDVGYALALGPRTRRERVLPRGLQATLRPYQVEGVEWLQHLRDHDAGGVLADDMGLGKTLQPIAHVLAAKEAGRLDRPAMIVTHTSMLG